MLPVSRNKERIAGGGMGQRRGLASEKVDFFLSPLRGIIDTRFMSQAKDDSLADEKPDLEDLRAAYPRLSEKAKKSIWRFFADKQEDDYVAAVLRGAGLDKGGFTHEKIGGRSLERIRERLDEFMLDPKNDREFEELLHRGLSSPMTDLFRVAMEIETEADRSETLEQVVDLLTSDVPSQEIAGEDEEMRDMIDQLRQSELFPLVTTLATSPRNRRCFDHLCDELGSGNSCAQVSEDESSSPNADDGDPESLTRLGHALEEACEHAVETLGRIRRGAPFDREDGERLSRPPVLREKLDQVLADQGLETPADGFASHEELAAFLTECETAEDREPSAAVSATWCASLADFLSTEAAITHRSPRKQRQLEEARLAAVEELLQGSEPESRLEGLPGPVESGGADWWYWLVNEARTEQFDVLEQVLTETGFERLLELVGDAELVRASTPDFEEASAGNDKVASGDETSESEEFQRGIDSEGESDEKGAGDEIETEETESPAAQDDGRTETPEDLEISGETESRTGEASSQREGQPATLPKAEEKSAGPRYSQYAPEQISSLAHEAKESPENRPRFVRDLAWTLAGGGYLAEAAVVTHLVGGSAEKSSEGEEDLIFLVPPSLFRANALAREFQGESDPALGELRNLFSELSLPASGPDEVQHAEAFLRFAAGLRPTLLSVSSGGIAFLQSVNFGASCDSLFQILEAIRTFANKGQALSPSQIARTTGQNQWEQDMERVMRDLTDWKDRARTVDIPSRPGAAVWRNWREEGWINGILPRILNDTATVGDVKEAIGPWLARPNALEDHATETYENQNQGQLLRVARDKMCREARELVRLLDSWRELKENSPENSRKFPHMHEPLRQFHAAWEKHFEDAAKELEDWIDRHSRLPSPAAAQVCLDAIRDIDDLFSGRSQKTGARPEASLLLKIPCYRWGSSLWDSYHLSPEKRLNFFLENLCGTPSDYTDAARDRLEEGDFDAYEAISEYRHYRQPDSSEDPETEFREDDVQADRREKFLKKLKREIAATQRMLDDAMRQQRLVTEQEYSEHNATIGEIDNGKNHQKRFNHGIARLHSVQNRLEELRDARIGELERELRSAGMSKADLERSLSALENGNIFAAQDYLERSKRGEPLPESLDDSPPLRDFFVSSEESPAKAEQIGKWLASNPLPKAAKKIRQNESLFGADLADLTHQAAEQRSESLETWAKAKRERHIASESVESLMRGLGFEVTDCARTQLANEFRLSTDLTGEKRCPVPDFGSRTGGRYRVRCRWDGPSVPEIVELFRSSSSDRSGEILFLFQALSTRERRELSAQMRRSRCRGLVVDEVLLLYIAVCARSQISEFFHCSLPFSSVNPYVTTSGEVPPEIFYGREREIEQILDPRGSSFVFGGRQLGKTALLRKIERDFHDPEDGHVALWVDIKGTVADSIWLKLAGEIDHLGFLDRKLHHAAGPENILDRLRKWLDEDESRRILLLLDEADDFLEADAQGEHQFWHCTILKQLMDRTRGRFKVVFAGLHNVQRSTKLSNHPLAHFGTPLCIGPLLSRGEAAAARDLVTKPLEAAGYFFEDESLVSQILAQTNYYPSLIQIYCNNLLDYLTDHPAIFQGEVPPNTVTANHLEGAYRVQGIEKEIRDRFDLTLQLDPRFRLIALLVAYYGGEADDEDAPKGLPVRELVDWATLHWPRGFERGDALHASFEELPEEMIGLGVLRFDTQSKRYHLRSPNLAPLLGSREEMEDLLNKFEQRPPPREFNPQHFRQALAGDPPWRSPLTATQEGRLLSPRSNGVTVICAVAAALPGEVGHRLETLFGKRFFDGSGVRDRTDFDQFLSRMEKRGSSGASVFFVPAEVPWELSWIRAAAERVRKLTSETALVQVVFLAEAERLWWEGTELRAMPVPELNLTSQLPWHDSVLRQWYCDSFTRNEEDEDEEVLNPRIERLSEELGNWPKFLQLYRDTVLSGEADLEGAFEAVLQRIQSEDYSWKAEFGLEGNELAEIFFEMRDDIPLRAGELAELKNRSPEDMREILRSAELLSLVSRQDQGWLLNTGLVKFFENASSPHEPR